MKIIREFKEFAIKGNMFDMAIGIIIGTAFSKIVTSIVNDIILPPFGFVIGKINFNELNYILEEEQKDQAGNIVKSAVSINYGMFLQNIIDFMLISITIFFVIKTFNLLRRRAEDVNEVQVPTPKDIELLSEIRDILKSK